MTALPFTSPVVARYGNTDRSAPLVVLLHGRGSHERDILGLATHLPTGPAYAAVRAPIAEGGGFAWFANRGIGRPVADSLRDTMSWFRDWLDDVAPTGRPVLLVGFSGGAAFAGGLVLADPSRYAGAAILYGTLPFDAGLPTDTGRLANLPVFVAQGDDDTVIPRDLLDRTWDYLLTESGAPTIAHRQPGGHQPPRRRRTNWATGSPRGSRSSAMAPLRPDRPAMKMNPTDTDKAVASLLSLPDLPPDQQAQGPIRRVLQVAVRARQTVCTATPALSAMTCIVVAL